VKKSILLDRDDDLVVLGQELGRGGEGVVCAVIGRVDSAAKIYHKPVSVERAAKLTAMVGMGSDLLLRVASWPTDTLRRANGEIAGFLMSKVVGYQPVFALYLPKPRLSAFPSADWRFLIYAAANAARAFAVVHAHGLVIGDVNHGNLVVAQDATVKLIDCDSFQVVKGDKTWLCEVGVDTHQPPEMQGKAKYDSPRTPNHDNFGLAVLIFQLLCLGRHPFAGRSTAPGDPPSIAEAITKARYAYARDPGRTQMQPPPGSLSMEALTPRIQDLFEKAFAPDAAQKGRPKGDEWVQALMELAGDLQRCPVDSGHVFRGGLSECPWCELEATGVLLFSGAFKLGKSNVAALALAFNQVTGKLPLGKSPIPPPPNRKRSREAIKLALKRGSLWAGAWLAMFVAMLVTWFIAAPYVRVVLAVTCVPLTYAIRRYVTKTTGSPYHDQLAKVQRDWEAMIQGWNESILTPELLSIHGALATLKAGLLELNAERDQALSALETKSAAGDKTGPRATAAAMAAQSAQIERDFNQRRLKLEKEASAALNKLKKFAETHEARKQSLKERAAELQPAYAQALADSAIVPFIRHSSFWLLGLAAGTLVLALASRALYWLGLFG